MAMFGPRSRFLWVGLVGILLLSSTVVAVDGYSLSGSDAIETPTRTVTFEGNEYTIDAISRIDADDSITVNSDVPEDEVYFMNLRGPDNKIIARGQKEGDTSQTFSYFGAGEAGSYAATIQVSGETLAVYPIVIAGYDIAVTPPAGVERGSETTIEADVTELDVERHSSLDRVQVVVGNEDVQVQRTMTEADGNTYSTTIDTNGIEPGTYNVYVVVRGDETVRQRDEILGVSDTVDLTVRAQGSKTEAQARTETTTPTQTATETATATPSESITDTDTPSSTATEISTETATESDGVLEPTTPTETPTTSASGAGFTVVGGLVAFLLGIGVAKRRSLSRSRA